ncbi:hypothetical protein D3C76_725110 [compost metagenome]
MASSYNKLTAEQVRANYRQQSLVADLLIPRVVDAMAGDPDGLIHKDKLGAPLKVDIPLWDERPPASELFNVLTLECLLSSSPEWVRIGAPEDIPGPDDLPDTAFPLSKEIPLEAFRDYEGKFLFRYRVKNWNGQSERESPPTPVTVDRTGPIWVDAERAMIDIVEKPVITDAVLARDKGVFCVIPDFIEAKRDDVTVHVAWLDRVPSPGEDITQFIVLSRLLPADRRVLVPDSAVTRYGSKTQYAVAILVDKAGNRGEMSLPATVQVALGTLPSGLTPCTVPLAADGVVDRADAAFPTKVHIEQFTGYDNNDGVVVKWGDKTLARTSVGSHLPFPLDITIPWLHMAQEYDFNSATHVQTVDVNYEIHRGDYPYVPPSGIVVNTNFAIPGPVNPDPEPINPNLNPVVFDSFSGSSTELTLADIGKDATASIKLFDDPEVEHTLTLYYDGVVVDAPNNPYEVDGTESPNQVIDIVIPWTDIERTPVMEKLPMYYTLTHKDYANPQESNRTTIDVLVEIVDLSPPEFPTKDFPGGIASCTSLKQGGVGGTKWGIFLHVPTSSHLKEGVDVKLEWQTYEYDGTTEISDTDYPETVTVSADQEKNGIDWFVPYDKCLKPTYRPPGISGGRGIATYTINVRGTPVKSRPGSVLVAVFESDGGPGNDHCVIPRP